jgi:hypothetical protein
MRRPKPPRPSSSELAAVLEDRNRFHRIDAFDAYSRHKPDISDLSTLRRALRDPEFAVANRAAVSIGKLGTQAGEAIEDLVAAATAPWENGCPQRFCDAIAALVQIAPHDQRLVSIIRPVLQCSNYGIFKAAVMALATIGTSEALDTIRWIDSYWGTARKDRQIDEFVQKIFDQSSGSPGAGQGQSTFVEHRGALFERHRSGGYRTSVYCPSCRGPMTSIKGTVPYQCRKCGVRLDFSARNLPSVIAELP